jgi:hypothetical protein
MRHRRARGRTIWHDRVMRTWWISLAFVAACGGSSKQAAEPVAAGPTCKTAAEHMVDELASGLDPRPPDDVMNRQIRLIRDRCEQDAWSPDAVKCLAGMKGTEDANRCATLLSEAQQAALVRDQEAASPKPEPAAEEGTMGRADGAAPAAAPPLPPPPAAAPAKPATRGPTTKGAARTEDPDQGGE